MPSSDSDGYMPYLQSLPREIDDSNRNCRRWFKHQVAKKLRENVIALVGQAGQIIPKPTGDDELDYFIKEAARAEAMRQAYHNAVRDAQEQQNEKKEELAALQKELDEKKKLLEKLERR